MKMKTFTMMKKHFPVLVYFKILIVILSLCSLSVEGQNKVMVPENLWEFGRVSDVRVSPCEKQILFGITYYDVEKNSGLRDLYVIDVAGGEPTNITNSDYSEFNAMWRPDGEKIGFLSSESGSAQIWEMNPDGTERKQVSDIPGGISGFQYSPDMENLFFIKKVKLLEDVHDLHPDLPKANARVIDDLMYRHWDSWHDQSFSHIFIAEYNDGNIGDYYDIMEDEPWSSPLPPFGGLSQIAWSPDGKKIAYTCKKLKGKDWTLNTNSDIYLFNLETKETTNLTEFNKGYDRNPVFSPDGLLLAWESMETPGFESDKSRIMIMDLQNGSYIDYSKGFDQSSRNFVWANNSEKLYFISGTEATYQIYSLNLNSKDIHQITEGWHNYHSLSFTEQFLIGLKMSMSMPSEIFKVNLNTSEESQLTFINDDVLSNLNLANIEQQWVETTDNKEMLVWVIYPPDFDPGKEYPALLYCQGGPQSAVSQFFSYRWNFQMMAANDYIIVAPNRRGLPTFGQEWNDQISQDYGGQNMQDYLSAIDALKTKPYIDENRLGAVGASYGGFSVYWLAGNHDGRFSAFISHCGMFNLESWYGSTEEMFFANHDIGGPYWEDPKPHSYDFSPHNFVGNWDTPILVVHGAKDYRIPYTQGIEAFNAAQLQGIPSRFLFFPEENHWVLQPQNSILWQREFFKWLDKWLK